MRLTHPRASLGVKAPNGFGKASGAGQVAVGLPFGGSGGYGFGPLGCATQRDVETGKEHLSAWQTIGFPIFPLKIRYQKANRRSTPKWRSTPSSRRPRSRWLGKKPMGGFQATHPGKKLKANQILERSSLKRLGANSDIDGCGSKTPQKIPGEHQTWVANGCEKIHPKMGSP